MLEPFPMETVEDVPLKMFLVPRFHYCSFRQSHFHVSDSLTDMDITERNQQLAFNWHTSLTQDERDNLANGNISCAEAIKRTSKRMKCEVYDFP